MNSFDTRQCLPYQDPDSGRALNTEVTYDRRNFGMQTQIPVLSTDHLLDKIEEDQQCWQVRPYNYKEQISFEPWKEWYETEDNFPAIITLTKSLLSQFPLSQHRIFSLGQTPAWIVKGVEMLAGAQYPDRIGYIAFSNNFVLRQGKIFIKDVNKFPNIDQIMRYIAYLDSIGMGVKSIIDLHTKQGIKTVIVDAARSGRGYVSFMSILSLYADALGKSEDLRQAVIPALLEWRLDVLELDGFIEPLSKQHYKFTIVPVPSDEKFRLLIDSFVHDIEHRLVPYYPPIAWGSRPILVNDANNYWILKELKVHLAGAATECVASRPGFRAT